MNKTLWSFLLLFLLISCKETTHTIEIHSTENEKTRKLDSLYSELLKYEEFNGNVLIAENDTVIFQKSFGSANRESKTALNENSIFNIASLTKQFTAAAILMLVEDGTIALNDRMATYIPELSFYEGITIDHLIHHTSGLPDYMQLLDSKGDKSKLATNDYVIRLFERERPAKLFEPNEKWQYSNTGYFILATIIERASGKSYSNFLREKIFDPLDMKNSDVLFVYRDSLDIENMAPGYTENSAGEYVAYSEYAKSFDGVFGQGRLYSTTTDLYKWDRALDKNLLFSKKNTQTLFSNFTINSGENCDYGFGWFLKDSEAYGNSVYHSGSWAGYTSYIERHLHNDKSIIILQNNGNARDNSIIPVENTLRILYDEPVEKTIRLSDELLQKYAGIYISEKGKELEILYSDKSLWFEMNPQMKFELIPRSETTFFVDKFQPEVTYEFFLDENGEVERYRVQQPEQGVDRTAIRKK
ncbi:MAG: serine hydrolase [Cryomorphaceae bacterium]|nr:beta-lactamase family protein [Flavobacteriales bacterium]